MRFVRVIFFWTLDIGRWTLFIGMNIAHRLPMRDVSLAIAALAVVLALNTGCSSPFAGDTLVARFVEGEPGQGDWERAVPLDLTVWKGNVNLPEEVLALDQETSHRSTPDCHHGPSTSDPVSVRIQALYNREELFVLLSWEDRTEDRELGTWEKGPQGWTARPGADDGLALLWEPVPETTASEGDGDRFRCQYACHMMEVDVYDGGTKMRMGMRSPEGQAMDLWRWRASVTGSFGLADDMVMDENGKRGDEGQVLPRENRSDTAAGPSKAGPGKAVLGTVSGSVAPYYIIEAPGGRQGDVRARARWEDGAWHLLLQRALDTADPDDLIYRPGDTVPFSISVFDNTFSEHHVSAGSALLVLWQDKGGEYQGRDLDEPMDF